MGADTHHRTRLQHTHATCLSLSRTALSFPFARLKAQDFGATVPDAPTTSTLAIGGRRISFESKADALGATLQSGVNSGERV